MAIESAAFLRRVARIVTLVLIAAFLGCVTTAAQAPVVTAGSILNMPQITLGGSPQIYRIVVAKNGNVLFLDTPNGAVYQLAPGATSVTTVSAPGTVLKGGNSDWNVGMALDTNDTLYIGTEWATPYFYRVPYDASTGTWPLTGSSDWSPGDLVVQGVGTREIAFLDNGDMVVSTESPGDILEFSISADGTKVGAPGTNGASGSPVTLVKTLTAEADKIAVDHAGNVYFIEGCWTARSSVAEGVWMIPAGKSGFVGETGLTRIDPPAANYNFKGITVDAAGNLYLSTANDSYGGNESGVLMVPNESGNPKAPTFSPTWADAVVVSPISTSGAVAIDPRGFLWIPTFTNTGWSSLGSSEGTPPPTPYTENWAAYALGSVNLGASTVGTAGTGAIVYYAFSGDVTPNSFVFSQPGSGSDFSIVTTNPLMNPATKTSPATVDTTVVPCTTGKAYTPWSACPYWVAVNPRVAGAVSGQLQMLDSKGAFVDNSAVSVYGVGNGPELSFLGSSAASPIGSGFSKPGQVAEDSLGNTYVADAGLKAVLQYPAGSTGSTTPVSILSGLTAPTGVAVDGSGNVYIGDTGQVIEVPYYSGALNPADKTVLQTGLGDHLNLAVDGAGDLYVADKDNAQVVKISNPSLRSTVFTGSTLILDAGLSANGFTAPSALAVDGSGDLFVADGNKLDEVTPSDWNVQTTITDTLTEPVTGLAVDASGSVYIAQSGGLLWIPAVATSTNPVGTLNVNDAIPLAVGAIVTPAGLALDRVGNLYVSISGATPGVTELSVNGNYGFGQVIPNVETDQEVQVYNIGNLPLTLSALASDSTTLSDFYAETAGDSPACGPTNSIPGGTPCYLGVGVTPSALGYESATLTIQSNATSDASAALGISANAVNDTRCTTTTTITGVGATTYPGAEAIAVKVALAAGDPSSCVGTPQGVVKLSLTSHGSITATLNSAGVANFPFTKLGGGNYKVSVVYQGSGTAGTAPDFAVSTASAAFSVGLATPSVSVLVPTTYKVGSTTYVKYQDTAELTMSVSSNVGTPTGTLRVMNGSKPADPTQDPIALDNPVFNTSNLAVAAYSLTIVYSGDQNYAPASVAVPAFEVVPESVQITATPATLTVTAGTPGTVTLTLQSIAGYGGHDISLVPQCISGVPQYAECTFDNNAIPLVSGGSATIHMTISTNVPVNVSTASVLRSGTPPWSLAGIFGFGLIGLVFGRKSRFNGRTLTIICLMLLFAGAFFGVTACNNSGYTHTPPAPVVKTPAGSYNVGIAVFQYNANATLPLPQPNLILPVTVQ
jgi:hypothetical protein